MSSKTVEETEQLLCPHFKSECKADACMMWRWKYDKINVIEMDAKKYFEQGFEQISQRVSNGIPYVEMVRSRKRGYCGLSSEPEI